MTSCVPVMAPLKRTGINAEETKFRKSDTSPVDPNSRFEHVNERFKAASKSPGKAPLGQRASEFMCDAHKSFSRHFIHLDSEAGRRSHQHLARIPGSSPCSMGESRVHYGQAYQGTQPGRTGRIYADSRTLGDMMRDIESGLLDGDSELPFAYENVEQAKVDYAHYHERGQPFAGRQKSPERAP